MRIQKKAPSSLIIVSLVVSISLYGRFVYSKSNVLSQGQSNADQLKNFQTDIEKAKNYDYHEDLARNFLGNGKYNEAADQYKAALEIIQNMSGDEWPNLKKEDADRINQQTRVDAQIFSRYGIIDALDKAGRYQEALEHIDWLMQNQKMKGKEEFLKRKLEGMKQNLLQKIQQANKSDNAKSTTPSPERTGPP